MSSDNLVSHPGTIINMSDGIMEVKILSASACSSCHAKGACSAADMEDKIIEVPLRNSSQYQIGQTVTVELKESQAGLAVVLAYVLPIIVIVLVLFLITKLLGNEGLAGLIALLAMGAYFYFIYRMKDRISNRFDFKLKD